MRYNLVLGDYRRLRDFTKATDKLGSCPNESGHSGRNPQCHNPSKGGRCLINCIGGSKIYIHNAVVATLAKRINGKGYEAKPGEATIHETVRKQADITVRPMSDIGEPWAVARGRCIRVVAKQHLKLKLFNPYQVLLVCLGEEIRSRG